MLLVKKLDIFILRNFLTLFAGTFCISLFVVMMQFLWKYIDDLIGKGLTYDVMAKFFFYAAETLVPLALPLAILLASLISFGNLGERFELLAIKAAGVSLFRTLRPLAILMTILVCVSYYFQDVIGPRAQQNLMQLLYSMRQKSPELDIPEGVFYDGIPNINLYVNKKNKATGMLYHVMIYDMRDGVENAHILLADSGRLETSSDNVHLLLHLYSGEQFENLTNNTLKTKDIPYRRETYCEKHFIIDFDSNFTLEDSETFSSSAATKNMSELLSDIDSLRASVDSLGFAYYEQMKNGTLQMPHLSTDEHLKAQEERAALEDLNLDLDTAFARLSTDMRASVLRHATQKVNQQQMDSRFKSEWLKESDAKIRRHQIQVHQKITLALACLVFFFIGAPLGAIIRKGGLGMPVVISILFFIIYYIINTGGMKLGKQGTLPVWLGMWASTLVLAPLGAFLAITSNRDSTLFNKEAYLQLFRKLMGTRPSRHIARKEVIIHEVDYGKASEMLRLVAADCADYLDTHRLKRPPSYFGLFFKDQHDADTERISHRLESTVTYLSNSRDRQTLLTLNELPNMQPQDHVNPFSRQRVNVAAGILFPIGIWLYFRMGRFRLRLDKDLKQIHRIGGLLAEHCATLSGQSSPSSAPTP